MSIDVICSWCNKLLRTKSTGKNNTGKIRVTHTICNSCKEEVMREYKKSIKRFRAEQRQVF